MEDNTQMPYASYAEPQLKQFKPFILGIIAVLIVIFLAVIALVIYNSQQFHLISTDPPLDHFPASALQIIISYNRPLSSNGISAYITPNIPTTLSISGKQLIVRLLAPLEAGKTYSIALSAMSSMTNDKLKAATLTFTPQNIPFQQLTPATQHAIMKNQDQAPPSRNTITFSGTDALLSQGVTTQQVDAMKQAVFLFGQSQKKTFSNAVIDPNSIQTPPYDPSTSSQYYTLTFTLNLDGQLYAATLQYGNLTVAHLILRSTSSNSLVYDSGNVDDTTLNAE